MIQQSFRAKFFLSMEECKEWEVAASRDEEIQNILASLARLATRNNSHFTREFRGRALGHMSMDSELPRKSLTRLFRPLEPNCPYYLWSSCTVCYNLWVLILHLA
ncbi:uncharacterized protein LOC126727639 isoform X2 [Quercus robur]|uniref:uncharacterized protein LOC126727639 isoform X2 n=1 Tax=Quercus robur TaxID=38942 RepID=UPI00216322CD|nr:uncharacterized protein LOC126727639 isoform X2 [Quercus robur]